MRRQVFSRHRRWYLLDALDRTPKRHSDRLFIPIHPHAAAQPRALPLQRKGLGAIPGLLLGVNYLASLLTLVARWPTERFRVLVVLMVVARRSRVGVGGDMIVVVFLVRFVFSVRSQGFHSAERGSA